MRHSEGILIETAYRWASPVLRRYFVRRGIVGDAEDLVQECFRRTIGRVADCPQAFLMKTAANLAIEHWRAGSRRSAGLHVPIDEGQLPAGDPVAEFEARDMLRRVERSLTRLKPRTRSILIQRRIEGLSLLEIASHHGLSVKAVEKQLTKALRLLRTAHAIRSLQP